MKNDTGIEQDPQEEKPVKGMEGVQQVWEIPGGHFRVTQVMLQDRTDVMNELVQEREWLLHPSETLSLTGNLFCIETLGTGAGVVLVQPGPLPHARPAVPEVDVRIRKTGGGCRVEAMRVAAGGEWVRLDWQGGAAERGRVLQEWQQCCRPGHGNHRTPLFLSNTWGDRSRDGRMREDFMLEEIEVAGQLGVDVVQLDDGWQKGITSNSTLADQGGVWEGFWNADPEFWTVHPQRFPRGLAPLVAAAERAGVRLGLWFAPDSWNEFVHWERDAACLVRLHREHGICFFKIDGIKAHTERSFERLRRMVARVLGESGGAVVFDLDITAEVRPGYWGLMEAGVLFVENRYTDWGTYWPHHTLRTLWQLSRWVDPRRLRMEFLNAERNAERYAGDVLAPSRYGADTLFAMVMCANPLGWFELSGLSEGQRAAVAGIVSVWKAHREAFFAEVLMPVGVCPDGFGVSGFLSAGPGGGYLVLFRGAGGADGAVVELPGAGGGTAECLHGAGEAAVCGGTVQVRDLPAYGHGFFRVTWGE